MAQSMGIQGVQGVQKTPRADVPLELIAALLAAAVAVFFLAMAVRTGGTPTVRFTPNSVVRTAPATNGWQAGAESAGFTGRLGAVAPQVVPYSYGQWVTSAAAAGFTGRLGGASATAPSSAQDNGGVNFTEKLKAGRA